jgi:4-aminobutyrate aminotransferase-like enzyme
VVGSGPLECRIRDRRAPPLPAPLLRPHEPYQGGNSLRLSVAAGRRLTLCWSLCLTGRPEALMTHFRDVTGTAAHIGEVCGRALAIGVDFVTGTGSNVRDRILAQKVLYHAWRLGAVV